ncbi:MAG: MFS transporter [Pseudomonadota bacterium]
MGAPNPTRKASAAIGRPGFAWAVFEWARNPYYLMVVIYIFAPYFARDVIGADLLASGDLDHLDPDTAQSTANAQGQASIAAVTKWAGIIAALTAPILGAALDRGGRLKPLLGIFFALIATCSALLWFALPGGAGLPAWVIMTLLVIAYVSYTYSEVTHNAMLPAAGPPESLSSISGLGLGLGNLAGAIIFGFITMLFILPAMIGWPFAKPQFGLDMERFEHARLVGPLCAVWIALFSVYFFLNARDPGTPGASWVRATREGTAALFQTFKEAKRYRELLKFLVAHMLYADGMAALLALIAVYYSLFLGWDVLELIIYAIYASIFAFAGGLIGGWLDNTFGVKRALLIEIFLMVLAFGIQLSITQESLLFGAIENAVVWDSIVFETRSDLTMLALVSVVAIAVTASISSSRAMLAMLAPPGRSGEFFGLYAIAGTITVWMGPLLVETFTLWFNDQRAGMASINLLFAVGVVVLLSVKVGDTAAPSHQ